MSFKILFILDLSAHSHTGVFICLSSLGLDYLFVLSAEQINTRVWCLLLMLGKVWKSRGHMCWKQLLEEAEREIEALSRSQTEISS